MTAMEETTPPVYPTCTCGLTPQDPANVERVGQVEGSHPRSWCRARLLEHVLNMHHNLMHQPEGWAVFGASLEDENAQPVGWWGEDLGGLPWWEKTTPREETNDAPNTTACDRLTGLA